MSVAMKPRPASTLALLRDGAGGLEVLMLQRTHQAVFMPGHYVFPGGAVDGNDNDRHLLASVMGHDHSSADQLLGVSEGGLGYLLAAVRECFEESGILLAQDRQHHWLTEDHPAMACREVVATGELSMLDLCRQYDLQLMLDGIAYLDHWITPPGRPRRFDTRFFAATAPLQQSPCHDGQETIDHIWITPQQALDDFQSGRREFAIPTRSVLERLMTFDTVEAVLTGTDMGSSQPVAGCGA